MPETVAQLTGLIIACYYHAFRALHPRLARITDRCALNLARELRKHNLKVNMRVHRTCSELHVNGNVLVLIYPVRRLTDEHMKRLHQRLESRAWVAGIVVSFDAVRPHYRRILTKTAGDTEDPASLSQDRSDKDGNHDLVTTN